MEFEDILDKVGGYGKYQKYLTLFFLVPAACMLPWITMNTIFMVSVPEHWCYVDIVASSNLSIAQQRAVISPPSDLSCSMNNINYTQCLKDNFSATGEFDAIPCTSGWQYDKKYFDSTAATEWNMVCNQGYFPSLVLSLQNLGSLILSPIFGYLADRFGRKKVYMALAVICCVTELISVLVDDFIAFALLRTIHSSVMPTISTLLLLIISEIVAPNIRDHTNGLYNCFWAIGLCILPLLAYVTRSWVTLGFVCTFIYAYIPLLWRSIPESPCWLISKGKYEEATNILARIGKVNGKLQDRACLFKEIQILGENIKKKKALVNDSSPFLLFKYSRIRRHFLILSFSWTAFSTTYFCATFNLKNIAGNHFLNFFLLSVAELPGIVLFWVAMNRAGRRWSTSFGFIAAGLCYLGPISGLQYSDVVCSIMGKLLNAGVFAVICQQSTELLPTVVRSFGMSLGRTISYLSTLLVPFLADLGAYSKELPFIVMSCISITAGILAAFLPETLNENLPQTISDGEEIGKNQNFFSLNRSKDLSKDEKSFEASAQFITNSKSEKEDYEGTESNDETGMEYSRDLDFQLSHTNEMILLSNNK